MKSVSIGVGNVDPPHRNRNDFGARRLDRGGIFLEAFILAGADDQARREGPSGDGPAVGLDVLPRGHSTPSDKMHDLIIVAVLDADLAQARARDDVEVAFDRHPQRVESKLAKHLDERDSARHAAVLAVHFDREASIESH
jgi:hypothetical protein